MYEDFYISLEVGNIIFLKKLRLNWMFGSVNWINKKDIFQIGELFVGWIVFYVFSFYVLLFIFRLVFGVIVFWVILVVVWKFLFI